jgi:TRAP-type C4-dicarboxylate transport system permease small subunit
MDWQVAASIATIIQAVVVIISLWLIWRQVQQQTVQIKQQTELTKIANTQALVGLSSPFNLELIKDAQMAALWVKGAEEYDNFDEVKKYQYESLLIWWLIFLENVYYQWNKGLLDQQAYKSLSNASS